MRRYLAAALFALALPAATARAVWEFKLRRGVSFANGDPYVLKSWRRDDTLDPAKRKALYAKALRIVHDDAPWLFLFQYEDLYATSKRLRWQPHPDEAIYCTEMRLQ
jgi:peptide/nickel transport system substrate-binding protein